MDHFWQVFIEFATILLLYALDFWLQGMWEFSSPTKDQTHFCCIGKWSLDLRQRGPKCTVVKAHSCVWSVCFSYSLSDLSGKSGTGYRSRRCSSGRRLVQSPCHRCHTSCPHPIGWLCGLLLTQQWCLPRATVPPSLGAHAPPRSVLVVHGTDWSLGKLLPPESSLHQWGTRIGGWMPQASCFHWTAWNPNPISGSALGAI